MSLFEFNDYRAYLRHHLKLLPKKGRGELSKIARHLGSNSTLLSQILGGTREFNAEQAYSLSQYLGHNELELEYFSILTQIERAGTTELKNHLKQKLSQIKQEALKLSSRISHERKLDDRQRAVFYSSWIFSAVHLFTSLKAKGVHLEEIRERFELPRARTLEIVNFLLEANLITENNGRYLFGVKSTFIEKGSPYLLKHHSNWRIKSLQKSEILSDQELMYTGQFSLSEKDFALLREQITELIKNLNATVKDSPAEKIAALNLDWFWVEK